MKIERGASNDDRRINPYNRLKKKASRDRVMRSEPPRPRERFPANRDIPPAARSHVLSQLRRSRWRGSRGNRDSSQRSLPLTHAALAEALITDPGSLTKSAAAVASADPRSARSGRARSDVGRTGC